MKSKIKHWIYSALAIGLTSSILSCGDLANPQEDYDNRADEQYQKLEQIYRSIDGQFTGTFTRSTVNGPQDFPVEINLTTLSKFDGSISKDGRLRGRPLLVGRFKYQTVLSPVEDLEFSTDYDQNTGRLTMSFSGGGDASSVISINGYIRGNKTAGTLNLEAIYTRYDGQLGDLTLVHRGAAKSIPDAEEDKTRRAQLMYKDIVGNYRGHLRDREHRCYLKVNIDLNLQGSELMAYISFPDYSDLGIDSSALTVYHPFSHRISITALKSGIGVGPGNYVFRGSGYLKDEWLVLNETETLRGPQGEFRARKNKARVACTR